jgi:hypothetical protein
VEAEVCSQSFRYAKKVAVSARLGVTVVTMRRIVNRAPEDGEKADDPACDEHSREADVASRYRLQLGDPPLGRGQLRTSPRCSAPVPGPCRSGPAGARCRSTAR